MKKRMMRVVAAGLAAVMALTPLAGASQALGTEIHIVTQRLGEGLEVTRQHLWSATYSDLRTEHYITYTPSEGIRPALAYGERLLSKETLTAMAARLEQDGGRVLGGINGDYYVVATGAPLGMVITEGELRSTPQYDISWGLGFWEDGTAFIGQPQLSVTATFQDQTLSISGGINKVREEQGGYYLLTGDFAGSTLNTSPGIDVILRPLRENLGEVVEVELPVVEESPSGEEFPEKGGDSVEEGDVSDSGELAEEDLAVEEVTAEDVVVEIPAAEKITAKLTRTHSLSIGGRVSCEVVAVLRSEGKIDIPEGCYVLTIHGKGNVWLQEQLTALTPGDRVELDVVSPDSRWEEAVTAVGGMYKLVTGGVVEEGLSQEQAPRSAVGIREDGSTVFYTVDGRQSGYSVGASLAQVAKRLVELGCVEAVCLDGGGSTTLGVTWPSDTDMTAINRPSDGGQRANSNALFLVSRREATGMLDHYYITPNDNLLLSGSSVQLTAYGVDTNGFPVKGKGDLEWQVAEGEGTVTPEGLFTAGRESGLVTVTVTDGKKSGSICIQVVNAPTWLSLCNEATGAALTSLHLEPGQSIDLTIKMSYWNLPLMWEERDLIWTVDPAVGKVDEQGVLTAAPSDGTGYLTVSAGEKSLSVLVTVSGHILPMEDFEGGVTSLIGTDTATVRWEESLEKVRYGIRSAEITYQAAEGRAIFGTTLPIPKGEKILSLWVYGDGSGNRLVANFSDEGGNLTEVAMTSLEFSGWRQILVELPEDAVSLQSIALYCGEELPQSGTFWLDQLTTANGYNTDREAPVIEMTVENGILQATVSDSFDNTVAAERIRVLLDGQPLNFGWNERTAKVTLALPQGTGKLHRVTVIASDISGNLARASHTYTETEPPAEPFMDMEGHWAQSYTSYLYQQGVTNGVAVEAGYEFQPEKAISRGEFALMVARWLGLDLEKYADVELPFADLKEIPDWMLPAIRAMYAEGIMKGSQREDGLYANATHSISRTESMTLLGRTQSRGYPAVALNFEDADQVPDWALEYVESLVAQGVVSGYNNQLFPQNPVKRGEVAKMLVSLM